jgi:AcrR family transcriptional regulator
VVVSLAPRQRRRSGEVHALVLEAARQTFAEKGYARTTTREIAVRAGVAETLLFRKFGSKAKLFAEAALQPLAKFIRDFAAAMAEVLPLAEPEATQRRFVEGLFETASAQRGILLTLFATSVFEPEVVKAGGAHTSIQSALDALARVTERELALAGIDPPPFDVPTASRSVIGMVLAMALCGDWLLPRGRKRPSRAALLDELTRQILYGGFNQRPKLAAKSRRGGRG